MRAGWVLPLLLVVAPAGAQVGQTKSALASYAVAVSGSTINAGMVGDVIAGLGASGATTVRHGFIGGTAGAVSGVAPGATPIAGSLAIPFPSPAALATTLRFALASAQSDVRLEIYDVAGRRVASLASGPLPAGGHSRTWNLVDERGVRVRAGVYIASLRAGPLRTTRTIPVLR